MRRVVTCVAAAIWASATWVADPVHLLKLGERSVSKNGRQPRLSTRAPRRSKSEAEKAVTALKSLQLSSQS